MINQKPTHWLCMLWELTLVFPLPDNSKEEVRLTTIPATTQPMKLNIGTHTITYVAKDKMSNKATCKFSVTVLGKGW